MKHQTFAGTLLATMIAATGWQQAAADQDLGTSTGKAVPARAAALGTIAAANTFTNANSSTGGVALRNRLAGGIEVSASGNNAQAAFLYWAVITNGAVPAADKTPTLTRLYPAPSASAKLTGTVVGTGASPCWGGSGITVFKASVPTKVVPGNGLYQVVFPNGASGSSKGGDPFFGTVYPLLEGASLVVVGKGTSTVAVYDQGLSGRTFGSSFGQSLTYTLPLPVSSSSVLRIDNIGADGQFGLGRAALSSASREVTTINGQAVAGPGSAYNDSDWNGNVGDPLPGLWDDTTHDLSGARTSSLQVSINAPGDCLTPIANVVTVQ